MKTMFVHYSQNNSGGHFDVDADNGIAHEVFIEVPLHLTPKMLEIANEVAQEIGIYFDGCSKEIDCDCCGDRWVEPEEYDIYENPRAYVGFFGHRPLTAIHYLDGTMEVRGAVARKRRKR